MAAWIQVVVFQLPTVIELPAETAATDAESITVLVGEQLQDDYQVIDLTVAPSTTKTHSNLVSTALLAHIEFLEAECSRLPNSRRKSQHFGIR